MINKELVFYWAELSELRLNMFVLIQWGSHVGIYILIRGTQLFRAEYDPYYLKQQSHLCVSK